MASGALIAGMFSTGGAVVTAAPALAADALSCASVYSIQGTGTRNLWQVDTNTGVQTSVGSFTIAGSTQNLNGLGIAGDGSAAIGVLPNSNDTGRTIYRHDRASNTTSVLGAGEAGTPVTHGAINPDTGFYYYGGFSGNNVRIYGFNTATNTSIGLVASGDIPNAGANGDWAFDRQGRLYVVGGGTSQSILSVIQQQLPTTAGAPIALTASEMVSVATPQPVNGIAFGGDGLLYLGSSDTLRQVDPVTGAITSTKPFSQSGSVDLASCATPNTITVQKDFPNGRIAPADQATLTLTGGGLPDAGIQATTAGTENGVQSQPGEVVGPIFGRVGTTYNISETGSGTAGGYATNWACINDNNGAPIASGTGTTGSFTMPAAGSDGVAVLCTFTNAARITGLTLDKKAGAPSGNTAGSTVPYTFDVTNTGNVPLETISVSDPLVGAVTCPAGPLPVGATVTCTAPPYTLTQADVNSGEVINNATATGTVAGLPDATDDDSTSTIIAAAPALTLEKTAGAPVDANGSGLTDAGDTIAYTFVVTNSGNLPINTVGITDDLLSGQDPGIAVICEANTLAPGESTNCAAEKPYTITEADEAAGKVVNTATATGTDPDNGGVTSNEDSTETPVTAPAPALTIEKTAGAPVDTNNSGITDAGDTIAYTFTVTNNGNVPLHDVKVNDPKIGAVTCKATTLAVGETIDCAAEAPYVVTEEDEAAGKVVNTATATGTDPDNGGVTSNEDSTETPVTAPAPALTIEKTAGAPVDTNNSGITDAGDTIAYTFTVTNNGNVPLHDVKVNDPKIGAVTCKATTLAVGETIDCAAEAPYVVTEEDEAAGKVVNTATATGTDPDNGGVTSNEDSTETPVTAPAPALTIEKTAGAPVDTNNSGITDAGDTIAYTFTVTNNGNVPLHDVKVNDPKIGAVTCKATTLAVGETIDCAADAPYVVTEEDEAAGKVVNTATATGTDPDNGGVTSNEDSTETPVTAPAPALTIEKTAGAPVDTNNSGITDAGDTIAYTFTVTNNGNVPLHDVKVNDPKIGAVTCKATTLAVGETIDCAADAPYVVTEEDEAAGKVVNTATATGTDPDNGGVTSNEDSTETPVTAPAPALTIEKTAGAPVDTNNSGITDAGDTIAYTFTVTNNGNVPLHDVKVNDPKIGAVTCKATTLAVGETIDCAAEAPYVITQGEVDGGNVRNVATATGTDPDNDPKTSEEDSTTTEIVRTAELGIDKIAGAPVDVNGSGITDAGDTIAYTFVVTNNGNVTISDVKVNDPKVGTVVCPETVLAPGQSVTCSTEAPYVVTEEDEAAGKGVNTATATGTDPDNGGVTSNEDSTETPVTAPAPALTIEKTAGAPVDTNNSGITDAGDTIAYTFTVTNNGNVPLHDVKVNDPKIGAVTCKATTLAVGETIDCAAEAPYVVTEEDEAAGKVVNTATATGTDPDNGGVTSNEDSTETPVTAPAPALTIEKTAGAPVDTNNSGITDAGDTIAYTFTVTNNGNVPLHDVKVNDPKIGAVTCKATTLAVGETIDCAADAPYVVTEEDEAAGKVVNTATATGTDPDNGGVTSNEDSTETPVTAPAPALTIEKTAGAPVDTNNSGITDAGDTIAYTFTVTNNGNVPLHDVKVNDPKIGAVTCKATTLAVGETIDCAADAPYVVTEEDEAAGKVVNTATATGTDPDNGGVTSNEDSTETPVTAPAPALTIEKTAGAPVDTNNSGITDAGDTIAYTFTVTNNGNVPLHDVKVNDPKIGAVTCKATTLAVGETIDCAADAPYVITQGEVDGGNVRNVATATGTDPDNDPKTSEEDSTTTEIVRTAELGIDKIAGAPVDVNGSGITDAGDTIAYTFVVTNNGNVTISDVKVNDPKVGTVVCPETVLAPGQSVTCSTEAPYVVTEEDEAAGKGVNTATATGTDPDNGGVTSNEDSTETPVTAPAPALTIEKTAGAPVDTNNSGITDAGDTIAYTFTVTNNGNVPLHDVKVNDPKIGAVTCKATTLAVGETIDCAAEAPYVVTEEDEAAGKVVNTATATGTDPDNGGVTSNEDSTETPVTAPAPALTIEKTAGAPVDTNNSGITDAGDTIAYTFTVTNNGNVPLHDVKVNDPKIGAVTCKATTLAVGETIDCAADAPYVVTEADELHGSVDNSATSSAVDPDGDPVTSVPDTTTTEVIVPVPSLVIEKTAGAPVDTNNSGITDAGDTIAYTFTVTNNGNVPVKSVAVVDPLVGTVACDVTELAPGAKATCAAAAVYTITAEDEKAQVVRNTAHATGVDPDAGEVDSDPDSTNTPVTEQSPALTLEKTAGAPKDANGNGVTDAGDTIAYTFKITNDGNVPVRDIKINDPLVGVVNCDGTELAAGESMNCSASEPYVLTQADVDTGKVLNVATATGTDPDNESTTSNEDSTTTDIARAGSLKIEKSAHLWDANDNKLADANETIKYSFTVTNTGNVTISDVKVNDPKIGAVICPETVLAPGQSVTCEAEELYTVTQAEVDAGSVDNVATASGTPPVGLDLVSSDPGSVSVPTKVIQSLKLVKDNVLADKDGDNAADAGEAIEYTFTATNTGTVTIDGLQIDDPMLSEAGVNVECSTATLAPGESVTCTATYTVKASDIESGAPIRNVASAKANGPEGAVFSPKDDTETQVDKEDETPLAITGGVSLLAAGIGGALLLAGLTLALITRRRRA
ncbi:hypothetical protein QEH68_18335 [Paenarthrobacter sp. OM7]|uniref:DUF7507 domain-containing protein n=1 Tax=Paenarthrobacter sp. OM7 TaxID=3041264 RepID=UPI0024692599|nr:hypothetical protein [Paenarthrobacter sp. OM7]WGM19959.1 hypothetical protein QEH68_18335 [Paenarthrobacter sp. OM7]